MHHRAMVDLFLSLLRALRSAFRSRANLALENLALRQQLANLRRTSGRPYLRKADRAFWIVLSRLWSRWADVLVVVKPDTVVRWHQAGFRLFWRWKSRSRSPAEGTTTGSESICRSARTRPTRGTCARPAGVRSWSCPRSAAFITGTSASRPEDRVPCGVPPRRRTGRVRSDADFAHGSATIPATICGCATASTTPRSAFYPRTPVRERRMTAWQGTVVREDPGAEPELQIRMRSGLSKQSGTSA